MHHEDDQESVADSVACPACATALSSSGASEMGFVLLDGLTVPVIGCDDHQAGFADLCGLTSTDSAELLHHRPAGGVQCPACRLAPRSHAHPIVPVETGAVGVLACPDHRTEVLERYETGIETRRQLTTGLPATLR